MTQTQPGLPLGNATRFLDGKHRVTNALRGVIPAAIAMPFVLATWAPTWFVVVWVALYVTLSGLFSALVLTRRSSLVEQLWSTSIALLFCTVPISVVLSSGEAEHFWAAGTVCVIFIAFELSSLPFLRIDEWRVGVSLLGLAVAVCGLFVIHPVVALALAPIIWTMIVAADRIRLLKLELEEHLNEAQHTLGHDALTGLLNRRGLANRIEELDGQIITVALIDVDRFKLINDSHGHQVGDVVLSTLAEELAQRLGERFSLARIGGDEIVAVAPGDISLDDSIMALHQVRTEVQGRAVALDCGFSIGVSCGENMDGAERLLSEAGFCMRKAKRSATKLWYFEGDLIEEFDRTIQIASMVNEPSETQRFEPVGQLILSEDRVVGCELLLRWKQDDGTTLLPNQFLPMAEDAGLMATINSLMVEQAIRFAARFNNRPDAPFVSVNMSASHLGEAKFASRVDYLLQHFRVPPERLMIEITETEQLGRYDDWEAAVRELRSMGIRLAIDDFGTGYSSIERLQRLPISHLKFDRSLVHTVSGPFGLIANGVAEFADALAIRVIAEGIETLDELESMRSFGISTFQGFYFHRPEALDPLERRILEQYDQAYKGQAQKGRYPGLEMGRGTGRNDLL